MSLRKSTKSLFSSHIRVIRSNCGWRFDGFPFTPAVVPRTHVQRFSESHRLSWTNQGGYHQNAFQERWNVVKLSSAAQRRSDSTWMTNASTLDRWNLDSTDTIFALSTPPGRSAVAVIRTSGPGCKAIYEFLCPEKRLPKPRYAVVRSLSISRSPDAIQKKKKLSDRDVIDPSALVLYFPAPNTVTGEDVLEFHVHGGPAVIQAVLRAIPQCDLGKAHSFIRPAEPGEFTKRAFLSGRLDLPQAEALGGLLEAETEQQRRIAVRGTQGNLGRKYEDWRLKLIEARGELEALIDFAEDQQFEESPQVLVANVKRQVEVLQTLVDCSLKNAVRGELLKNGIRVTILGKPNAGKSSLLNLLVGREAAIVSDYKGTTRDIVEVNADVNGYPVKFSDTAGLRSVQPGDSESPQEAIHPVEIKGMERALERAQESDVIIFLLSFEYDSMASLWDSLGHVHEQIKECIAESRPFIIAVNKIDKFGSEHPNEDDEAFDLHQEIGKALSIAYPHIWQMAVPIVLLSCKLDKPDETTGELHTGIQELCNGMSQLFRRITDDAEPLTHELDITQDPNQIDMSFWQEALGATERQRFLLNGCKDHLKDFLALVESRNEANDEIDVVLAAEHLRSAADCLARITGKGESGDVEEVLGVVFSKFCVGK